MAAVSSSGRASMSPLWFGSCGRWSNYDPVAGRRAGVACDRLYRHAQGLPVAGLAGSGDPASRPARRSPVLLPRTARQSVEGDLARRTRRVPVHEASGTGALPVAEPGRRRGDDLVRTARLSVVRHRLAYSAGYAAADVGWIMIWL